LRHIEFPAPGRAVNSGANHGADELFPAAVPSLLPCHPEDLIYESSSRVEADSPDRFAEA
jgi:hypothetical protein